MVRKKKLEGMMTIEITPFTSDGLLDEESYIRELNHIVDSRITAVIAGANISEGWLMPDHVLKRLFQVTLDQINDRIPVGFGTLHNSLTGIIDLVKTAEDMGADFTMTPPCKGSLNPEKIYECYSKICSRTDIPLMLYDSIRFAPIPPETVLKLVNEFSNICYFKAEIDNSTVYHLAEKGILEKIDVFCGQEQYLMPHLQDGAIGGTNSVAIVAPKLTNAVFKAAKEKNWTRAWTAFRKLWPIMMTLYNPEYRGRAFKETLYMMGVFDTINFCDIRKPLLKEEKANLRENLLNAGVKLIR